MNDVADELLGLEVAMVEPNQWTVFGRRRVGEMAHLRLGLMCLSDEAFERLLQEREELLAGREAADQQVAAGGVGNE